jgi:hypothetical protein
MGKLFFDPHSPFEIQALKRYKFQQFPGSLFQKYTVSLGAGDAVNLEEIAFLPISFFKTHLILAPEKSPAHIFESSGTTGQLPSRHALPDSDIYRQSILEGFNHFWGDPASYCFLGLLPSYLERPNASLVFMMQTLMDASPHPKNGFYLHNLEALADTIKELESSGQKTFLVGVTFALLDLAQRFPQPLRHTLIVETGGMKGRRKELVREELHLILTQAFGLPAIASEYGMTEMLSQAWSTEAGVYRCPPWMRVYARPHNDPMGNFITGETGRLHVVDLANVYSCSFIATDDLGKVYPDGSFEVLGRTDHSDLRGCNLMV